MARSVSADSRRSRRGSPDPGKPRDLGTYFARLQPGPRKALQGLRRMLQDLIGGCEEGMSYGLPTMKLNGRSVVCYGAFIDHFSLFPMSSAVLQAHTKDLAGRVVTRGSIHFQYGKPLPVRLIRRIVNARLAEMRVQAS